MRTNGFTGFILGGLALTVAACGNTPLERGATGAAIGAAAGAGGSAILDGDPATGAIIGGVVGGAVGALTDRDDIDIGDTPF